MGRSRWQFSPLSIILDIMKTIDLITLIGSSVLSTQAALAKTMRQVCEADAPLTIDGAGKDQVVMMPLATFNQLINSNSDFYTHPEVIEND